MESEARGGGEDEGERRRPWDEARGILLPPAAEQGGPWDPSGTENLESVVWPVCASQLSHCWPLTLGTSK